MQPTLGVTLDRMKACASAVVFARGKTLKQAWKSCSRPDWMCWLLDKAAKRRVKGWPKKKEFARVLFEAIEDNWEDFCPEYYLVRDHVLGERGKKLSPMRIGRLQRFFQRHTPAYTGADDLEAYRQLCIVLTSLCARTPNISAYTIRPIVDPVYSLSARSAAKIRRYYSPGPYNELVKKVWKRS